MKTWEGAWGGIPLDREREAEMAGLMLERMENGEEAITEDPIVDFVFFLAFLMSPRLNDCFTGNRDTTLHNLRALRDA